MLDGQFEAEWQEARGEITASMAEVKTRMDRQQSNRDEVVGFMVNAFGEEILKLEEQVQKEREARTYSHQRLAESISAMEEQVGRCISGEKKETSTSIANLEGYL